MLEHLKFFYTRFDEVLCIQGYDKFRKSYPCIENTIITDSFTVAELLRGMFLIDGIGINIHVEPEDSIRLPADLKTSRCGLFVKEPPEWNQWSRRR